MAKKHHFDFQVAIAQALQGLGVQQNKHEGYDWQLDTRAGLLRLHPVETGLDCRFENIELANQVVRLGYLNRSTGEWNHRFNKPSSVDVDYIVWQLELIIEGRNPAPSFSGYCPMWEKHMKAFEEQMRASGHTVTVMESSDSEEFTVTFPPNRPSHAKPRRPTKRDLRTDYLAMDFVFEVEGQSYTLRIGEQSPHVRDLLVRHGVQGAAFITAYNPASLNLGEVHNKLAMRALRKDLKRGSDEPLAVFEGVGQGRTGVWPAEPSLMVLGVSRDYAEQLARRYGQYAIVWVDETGTSSLVELADLDRASRHPLRNPPFKWIELGFEWGYEWVDVRISPSQWRRILAGEDFSLRTQAWNDGEGFRLYWGFDGGDRLYVSYGDDGGTAFDGKITGMTMSLP